MVTIYTTRIKTQQFYVLSTQCIYVFCVDIRINSDYFSIQHERTGFYNPDLTLYSPVVIICTTRINTQQFYVLSTQCIYVFCVDLRTNCDYFPIQHELTGFYNRDLTHYSPVVTKCTTRIKTQQFFVLSTQCIYVYCADLRTNSYYLTIQH